MKATRTIIHGCLTDLSIEDLTENTLYPHVVTIEDEKAVQFKVCELYWDLHYSEQPRLPNA